MLAVYFGTDTNAVRHAAHAAAAQTGVTPQMLTSEEYEPGQLADQVGGNSLFGETRTVVIDTPADVMADELPPLLEAMAASADTFIIIEGPLRAAQKKQYAKHTEEIHEYKAAAAERFNTFSLADALAKKQKKQLWLGLQQASAAGISPEELIGILWWQLKSIRLAAVTDSAAAAGMKDFPYRKAKSALARFPLAEAEQRSRELLSLYHQGHAGEVDLPVALEHWVLTL